MNDHDPRQALLATPLTDVIRMFGIEIILLWTAIMMKKRVAVYSDDLPVLLRIIRSFPLFAMHRKDWSLLRPFITLDTEEEMEDLKKAKIYCAGFIDPNVQNQQNIYDVFVDINARSIVVAEHAKAQFRLGAFHKDLATWMVQSAEEQDLDNTELIKQLAQRNKEFLRKLLALTVEDEKEAGVRYITQESLAERSLPPHMDQFIYAVASAEGMTKETLTR